MQNNYSPRRRSY